jgi:hypothetical protein
MRNADIRINKYFKKMSGGHLGHIFKNQLTQMAQNYADWTNEVVEIENMVKSILDNQGVIISLYPMYLCFARELLSLKKRFSSNVLFDRADLIVAKWSNAGLDPTILETIRREIFTIAQVPPSQP